MAQRVADTIAERDIVHLRTSPLERAQETAAPLAAARGLTPVVDPRVIESANVFEGKRFGDRRRRPAQAVGVDPPVEPVEAVVGRALQGGHRAACSPRCTTRATPPRGHEAVIVSHQLPIWITRLALEKRSFLHDPRKRQCTLCSLTSLQFDGDELRTVSYSEPAGDLIPVRDRKAPFSAGDAPEAHRP